MGKKGKRGGQREGENPSNLPQEQHQNRPNVPPPGLQPGLPGPQPGPPGLDAGVQRMSIDVGRGGGGDRGRGGGGDRGRGGGGDRGRGRGDDRGRGRGDDRGRGRGEDQGRGRGDDRGRGRGDDRGRGRGDDRGRGRGDDRGRGRGYHEQPPQYTGEPRIIPGFTQDSGPERKPSPWAGKPTTAPETTLQSSISSGGTAAVAAKSSSAPAPSYKSTKMDTNSMTSAQKNQCLSLIPVRKNPLKGGSAGRPIQVLTNMISIMFKGNLSIPAIHYDVKFDPDKPKFLRRLIFEQLRVKEFPKNYPAFDGRVNAYSAGNLPFGENLTSNVMVFDHERQQEREFKVTMVKVNSIDMSWLPNVRPGMKETEITQTTIQVLDVILRSAPSQKSITVGRSFFPPPLSSAFDLSGGMEMLVGTFQSAVLGWKPLFNVDVAHKGFPKPIPVIDLIREILGNPRYGPLPNLTNDIVNQNFDVIQKFLKGLKVIYQLPDVPSSKRTVGVNGLGDSSKNAKFPLDNGTVTTVFEYFKGSKRYIIRNPELQTLWIGSRNKTVLVPMELCKIAPGIVVNTKLNEEQTRRMIRETATSAQNRKDKIMQCYNQMNYNANPTMKEFGISLSGQFEQVNARVLNPPTLKYQRRTEIPRKGVWRASEFLNAQVIPDNSWTILNLSRASENNLRLFVQMLTRHGSQNGMTIGKPLTPFDSMRLNVQSLQNYLRNMKKAGIKFLVVVIPGFGADVYPKVKQQAELQVGMLTQCVKENTVMKMVERNDASTAGNILLKINSKLNGINHTFDATTKPNCLKVPVIIFGADVTHPSPDATAIPSIAAVAASHSSDVFKYNVDIRLQPPRQEVIVNLEEIVIKQLQNFQKSTNVRPQKIFFYRDGVSEGQFAQVLFYELSAIRNACRKFAAPTQYEPKITFLVVQKRHHIRLFPTDSRNSDDRNGNVQAGTIVDTHITHPSHIDFYLVSHASIQGTARPTKYRCLCDENDMTEDEIEQLTYYLCHMFSRCTRSVSYPAPTYYAHLAAFRARALTYGVNIQMDNLDRAQLQNLTLHGDLVDNNPMFFV